MLKRFTLLIGISTIILIINFYNVNANIYLDDLEKSIDLYESNQFDASTELLNDLIKSSNLDEQSLTRAFLYRGLSNYENNKFIASITDLTNSLWLDLLNDDEKRTALETRANAREKIGQVDLANQDKDTANKILESKTTTQDETMNKINVEDLNTEIRIDNMKNKFSLNVSNFFGSKDIEGVELPVSDYVVSDQEIYENILDFNETSSKNNDLNIFKEEIKEDENITTDQSLSLVNEPKVNSIAPVAKVTDMSELDSSYIILSRSLEPSTAKVKINKIINDNFRVLSGISPQSIENIDDDGNIKYDI
ncbi:MAG: hypothetical protein VW298_02660, partial [Candidatus Woesearchaeota archaeon]